MIVLCLSGCHNLSDAMYTATGTALNTYVTITLYGQGSNELAASALKLCSDYEHIFSRTDTEALLYRANAEGGFAIDSEESRTLADLIAIALDYAEQTNGAFDPTICPVSALWDFGNNTGTVPEKTAIEEAKGSVDYHRVKLTETSVDFGGASLDLGGIAKGYIADRVREYLTEAGVKNALINLGGNILTMGTKNDGSAFTVGIQEPFSTSGEILAKLSLTGMSAVTSGVYERYFYADGTLYHHLLDPRTGYPCTNGLYSVTILNADSTACDALSTACFVLGREDGMALIETLADTEAIFVDEENELYYSSGAKNFLKE